MGVADKSEAKKPDFDANQSSLLMGVVMIFKYGGSRQKWGKKQILTQIKPVYQWG